MFMQLKDGKLKVLICVLNDFYVLFKTRPDKKPSTVVNIYTNIQGVPINMGTRYRLFK